MLGVDRHEPQLLTGQLRAPVGAPGIVLLRPVQCLRVRRGQFGGVAECSLPGEMTLVNGISAPS
jgi:hypothetical protein